MKSPTSVGESVGVRAVRARLEDLVAQQARLRTRHHALSLVIASYANQRVVPPPELADVRPRDAAQERGEIDRELVILDRRIDAEEAELLKADVAAQATILEAELPAYRRLVAVRDRAQAALDQAEAARQDFLADLRRRGVFQTPPLTEEEVR